MTVLSAGYFDQWYAASIGSAHDGRTSRMLELPGHVRSNSSLPGPGLDEIISLLSPMSGRAIIDLGCGRGHLTREIARRVGCPVTGVDFSRVAIEAARADAVADATDVTFVAADMTGTGLPAGSADGIVSIDALYFPRPLTAVAAEARRLLTTGGLLIATGWEPRDRPARMPDALAGHGFVDVVLRDRPTWSAIERERWLQVLDIDNVDDDPSLAADQAEAERVLAEWDQRRRVLVSATAA